MNVGRNAENSGPERRSSSRVSKRLRRRWLCMRSDEPASVPFFEICDMRVATVFLNVFNIGFIVVVLILQYLDWRYEWPHLLPSFLFSVMGLLGALRVNLTLTYISTLGFSCLSLFYGLILYIIGLIIVVFIILSQMLLICDMMEGVITKQDDALLSKEGKEVIRAVESFASDITPV
mmetsp:Transcript_17974/g.29035  ORF Transcript_17974/g.29035 Transcript_17974/m.29035 type:complete len:177 (-) Transcript_17974:1952-2482(-)